MVRFDSITEQWDSPMSARQMEMAQTRYQFAAEHSIGRDVLEIGCGTGFGLAFVAEVARRIVGGDVTESNAVTAHSRTGLPLVRLDAHALPFADQSFDVALLFESIYYLNDPARALRECRRVLRPGGPLLICLPNRDRPGFHPSPYSVRYFSVSDLAASLRSTGFVPEIFGAFPIGHGGPAERLFLVGARIARRLHMIPRSLHGRARIKRLLRVRMVPFHGLDPERPGAPLVRLAQEARVRGYVNLYAIARRDDGG